MPRRPQPPPPHDRPRAELALSSVTRPKQARSEETLCRILDAAESLIDDKGLADASIPEIVRRAGSSVGGFYARFKDKTELLRALEERFFNQISEKLEELADPRRWVDAELHQVVRVCVEEMLRIARERRSLIAAFLFRAASDDAFRQDGLLLRRRVSSRMSDLLLTRRAELGHPDPAVAIDLAVQLAFGTVLQTVIFGENWAGGRRLSDSELVRELTRNFLAYLGVASNSDPE